MATSQAISTTHLRNPAITLLSALAALSLGATANLARAEDMDQVTVVSSTTHVVGYHAHDPVPIKETTVKARVTYNPVTLTTHSGVALLRDAVHEAARKACKPRDVFGSPFNDGPYRDCVRTAVESAQPQVAQAIAAAERAENG